MFINNFYLRRIREEKSFLAYEATKLFAMARAVIKEWAMDFGFGFRIILPPLLFGSFHTSTLKIVYPSLIL